MMYKTERVLLQLMPEGGFSVRGEGLENVIFDNGVTGPETLVFNAAMDDLERNSYIEKRLAAYPAIGDQLDAIWKGGGAAEAMRQQVLAVKVKYPKPDHTT